MRTQYNFKISFLPLLLLSLFISFSCDNNSRFYNGMVSSAHPIASKIGLDILKSGGNAFDAAVAVHFALSVVYPNAGNIGGGGFLVYRLIDGEIGTLDFREKAPENSFRDMYIDNIDGKIKVDDKKSKIGHLASGIPGSVDGMVKIYEKFSNLEWDKLLDPSIKVAREGFEVTEKQAKGLNNVKESLLKANDHEIPFIRESEWKQGNLLIQENLAQTLEEIKESKRDGFYKGKVAELIINEMISGGGIITQSDLDNYSSVWRNPIVGYFKNHKIISMGPPSSGGIALVQLLNGAEQLETKSYNHNSAEYINTISEIESRVYADRATHLGDPDFFNVPQKSLLDKNYLTNRFSEIKSDIKTPSSKVKEGSFVGYESDETTHFSIVDKYGNAVSVTTTINGGYGSKVVVEGAGFLLNNEMDDFSVKPGYPNMFGLVGGEANAIEPNKRMLSSMTPTIIEKNDKLLMVLGTPGGSTIITSVFQTILNVIDYGMDMQKAVDAKKFHHQWLPDVLVVEKTTLSDELSNELSQIGHNIVKRSSLGRMDCILINEDGSLEGGADKRGDNIALGY
jgi:gamma-glutamyltranspeptidase/glutathione hydrolase